MIGTLHEWTPASDVTDHVGNALEADRVFFAPPPLEIGKIISAYSTILRNKNPNPPLPRVIAALALGSLAAFFAWMGLQDENNPAILGMGVLVAGSLGAMLGYMIIRKTNVCTYVGENGVARYNIKNLNDTPRQSDLLRFADVAELRTRQTRNYYNGVYTGTTYNYTWSGGSGNRPFTLSGTYHSSKGDPPPGDAFRFAGAAEAAWSAFAFERAKTDLQRNGAVRFSLQHNNYLVVGEGYIEISSGARPPDAIRKRLPASPSIREL